MANKNWLNGKTAIVTGASGGMGAGIVEHLIKDHDCTVIGIARNEEKMKKFVERLGPTYAAKFSYKLFDVSQREHWETFAEYLKAENIHPDILINNAGILPKFKRFDRFTYDELNAAMNINFYSALYSIKTLLPMLLESPEPAIINVSSSASLMTLAGTSAYSASKAAVKALTEALRTEFRGKMYVGLVCPGFTKTDIFRNQGNVKKDAGDVVINMVATDCDKMVNMIMNGIENKRAMQVHGPDAHFMSIFNRLFPVFGASLFSGVMRLANVNIFEQVFKD